jgi:membrane protein YqaA with SNARE-associated domain
MDVNGFGARFGIYAGTLVVCFLSGLLPFVNAEVWLVAVTLTIASPSRLPIIVVLAAAGQVGAKVLLYYGAKGAIRVPTGRFRAKVERARDRVASWKKRPHAVLWSAATLGLPPFYVVSLLAGALEYRLRALLSIGMAGRTIRFGVVVALAWYGYGVSK